MGSPLEMQNPAGGPGFAEKTDVSDDTSLVSSPIEHCNNNSASVQQTGHLPELQTPFAFLNLLYPDTALEGWLTLFAKGPSGKKTGAFHRSHFAVAQEKALARAKSADVWYGVGLRVTKPDKGKRGTSKEVIAIPGLWFDLDVKGPGHAQEDLPTSVEEALEFLASLPLTPTVVVFSGGGLQPYWLFHKPAVFATEDERTRIEDLSKRWHRFIMSKGREQGWKLDNTADLARILRLPGTHNWKTGTPRPVTVPPDHVDLAARYEITDFEAAMPQDKSPDTETPPVNWPRNETLDADLSGIVEGCAWMRHCRDDATSLPEPEWYACLSILARCEDGENLAQDWSAPYPDHSWDETNAKFEHALKDTGPRTCAKIKAEFGEFCTGCTANVKSPVVLGRRNRLPDGYQTRDDGIYYRVEDKDGAVHWVWMCSPIKVLALTRDAESREWGRLIEVVDPAGRVHQWAMPMEMLAGSGEEYRRELLSLGLRLAAGKAGAPRLHNFLSLCNPQEYAQCVSRIGWHGRQFVLPDNVYGSANEERVFLQTEKADNPFKTAGSLADWQEFIGRYCQGNSRLISAVSAALAAPLLNLADGESGGFHLMGGSSLGKTTALAVAGSVCGGGGVRGYARQWRSTANGLESIAAAHCDSLLALDELSQVAAKEAAEVAYMLSNGAGKTRANKSGGVRKPAEWRVLFFSTGEISLDDKIREDGRGRATAGQAVRVVDIEADAGAGLGLFEDLHGFADGDAFSRHLKKATGLYFGTPLRAFLERMVADFDEAARIIPTFIKNFVHEHCPVDADGQVKRVCARFSLLAAAGERGVAYGVLPWPVGEATQAAVRCFRDWLTKRGGTGAAEVQTGLTQVRAFFQAHGASRFETWGEITNGSRIADRVGFRRKSETGAWEYFVPATAFKNEIARGHDAGRLTKELALRELILPGPDGQPASGHRIPGQPYARYYHFAPAIVSDDSYDLDRSLNTVTSVAPVAASKDKASSRNRPHPVSVASVAPDSCNRRPATAATSQLQSRLQEKFCDFNLETGATAATVKRNEPFSKQIAVVKDDQKREQHHADDFTEIE